MPLTANGIRVVMRQIGEIDASPIDGIQIHPSDDLSELLFELDGPEGTPFSDGRFRVALVFDEHYPQVPPKGFFRTKIFHPNVSDTHGDICVNALKRDWSPQLGLRHVLLVIRCLLVEPNPESALNEEAGRLLLDDYADYARKARMLTNIHAKRPPGMPRIAHTTATTGSKEEGEGVAGRGSRHSGEELFQASEGQPQAPAIEGNNNNSNNNNARLRDLEGNTTPTASAKRCETATNDAAEKNRKKTVDKKKAALRRI